MEYTYDVRVMVTGGGTTLFNVVHHIIYRLDRHTAHILLLWHHTSLGHRRRHHSRCSRLVLQLHKIHPHNRIGLFHIHSEKGHLGPKFRPGAMRLLPRECSGASIRGF